MDSVIRPAARGGLAFAILACLLGFGLAPERSGAAVRGCGSFASQAEAQEYFLAGGGAPGRPPLGALDPDRDGVACESLPGPYEGYATIGYNRANAFFYGSATMPSEAGGEGFACLRGNRHFPDAARHLNVYRVRPGADERLFGDYGVGAEVKEGTGRLLWRADRALRGSGRYYAAFEERIPLAPYGENPCPGFSSRPALLAP